MMKKKANENAVFGPSPPRMSLIDAPNATAIADAEVLVADINPSDGAIIRASADDAQEADLFNATVVATVNGRRSSPGKCWKSGATS